MPLNCSINALNPLLQISYNSVTSVVEAVDIIPMDDTIPQQSEGTEIITHSFTPVYTGSLLEICFNSFFAYPNVPCTIALFRDSSADAIDCAAFDIGAGAGEVTGTLIKYTTGIAGVATTFKVRAGPSSGIFPMVFNGTNPASPSRVYGGTATYSLTVKEYGN